MKSLHTMFEDGLKDMYNAEKQLVKAMPKLAKLAKSKDLKSGIEKHMTQTEEHIRRLDEACKSIGIKPTGVVCHGMMGLVEEAKEHTRGLKASAATDAEIIAIAQKAEHYEIASYGTLCEWAKTMNHEKAYQLLKLNLADEELTDQRLSQLAEGSINRMAAQEAGSKAMGNGKVSASRAGKNPRGRASVM